MTSLLLPYLVLFASSVGVRFVLDRLNMGHLRKHGHTVPAVFQGEIEPATLERIRDYTVARTRIGLWEDLFQSALVLLVLFSGLIPWLAGLLDGRRLGLIPSGIIFFFAIGIIMGAAGIPFDLYRTFGIERRFGFSTITLKLWLADFLKATLISAILSGILLAALFGLIGAATKTWWLWMWIFYAGFQLLMTVLYPLIIAPLFNKFEPLDDPLITGGVMSLMDKAGLKAKGVYRVDALKRSRHSNAYFTGLGRSRRIVLFDSLLSSHAPDEILAVLAHEIGHWKKGHIRLQLCGALLISLALLYGAYLLINWPVLYSSFGIPYRTPYVGLLLLGFLMQPVAFFLSPLASMISRAFERQSDDYARSLTGQCEPLIRALKRLSTDNLSNLHPHPLYAWFYYTHPPLVARIERLKSI